jgi:glutamate racemase
MNNLQTLPIGVFDSGVGGLTVLQALQRKLPQESFLYLGDTARLPYGTKSAETITRYAKQAVNILLERGIKCLVLACNTATAASLPALQQLFPQIPIIGVIAPGAQAACDNSITGKIAVIATEATIKAQGYQQAIKQIRSDAQVVTQACGLFVPLAEEGWIDGPIAEAIAKEYLTPLMTKTTFDCLVLGCTHYPTLVKTLRKVIGEKIAIVDSATTTAQVVEQLLMDKNLLQVTSTPSTVTFIVTDAPERFAKIAKQFVGIEIGSDHVELVDLV